MAGIADICMDMKRHECMNYTHIWSYAHALYPYMVISMSQESLTYALPHAYVGAVRIHKGDDRIQFTGYGKCFFRTSDVGLGLRGPVVGSCTHRVTCRGRLACRVTVKALATGFCGRALGARVSSIER